MVAGLMFSAFAFCGSIADRLGYHWPCGIYSYGTGFLPRRPFPVVLREVFGTTPWFLSYMDVRTLCEYILSLEFDRLCTCLLLPASYLDGFGLRSASVLLSIFATYHV